jgi:hypothetical protein
MVMGRLFNFCGCPGISPINCLLVGRSMVCESSATGEMKSATVEATMRNFARISIPRGLLNVVKRNLFWRNLRERYFLKIGLYMRNVKEDAEWGTSNGLRRKDAVYGESKLSLDQLLTFTLPGFA